MDAVEATLVARKYIESKVPNFTGFKSVRSSAAIDQGQSGKNPTDYVVCCNFRIRFKTKVHSVTLRVAADGTIRGEHAPLILA